MGMRKFFGTDGIRGRTNAGVMTMPVFPPSC